MRFNKILTNPGNQWLYPIVIAAVSLLAYSAVLIIGVPREIGLAVTSSLIAVLIPITLLLYLAYRQPGWIGTLASLSLTLILFALPLSGLWTTGLSNSVVVGGLLPYSDAGQYYTGAKHLLEGDTLNVVASWRPLFSGTLATLLGLTQQNLQVTLAILGLINAISCFLLAREVQRSHGTVAGVLVLIILFLFYERTASGKAMTENLGLALGAVGLAILWRGALNKRINLCLLGIFLLTLALNARAGAFFILPALILWGAWSFRGSSRFSQRFLIGGVSVVLLGFILNSIVLKTVGSPNAVSNGNFSHILYGLISGGDWRTVKVDHPEVMSLAGSEMYQRIYALAFEALRANPFGLVSGLIRAWKDFFMRYFFPLLLTIPALFHCYRQRQSPNASLMIAAMIGILASVPFMAGIGVRVYAATIPVYSILPALGLAFIAQQVKWHRLVQVPNQNYQPKVLLIFGIGLALLSFWGPIATKMLSHPLQFADVSCPASTEVVYFRNSPGSSINLVADNAIQKTYVPNVRISDFRNGLKHLPPFRAEIAKGFADLTPNTTVINALNLKNGQSNLLIADSTLIPKEFGIVGVCAKVKTSSDRPGFKKFFIAESMALTSQ